MVPPEILDLIHELYPISVSIGRLGTSRWLKKGQQFLVNTHENQNNLRNKLQIYVPNASLDFYLSTPQFLTDFKKEN
jgi:hypothetical protein